VPTLYEVAEVIFVEVEQNFLNFDFTGKSLH